VNHASPGSGTENANCKETSRKQGVSCNHEVSNADDFYAISAASEFFTTDYLRTLLIHGARAALPILSQNDTPLGHWLKAMIERGVHRNAVVVALANKLARIAWAVL